jgi:hypothetical protein
MDNVRFFTHFFFTPNRLVWKNWAWERLKDERSWRTAGIWENRFESEWP